MQLGERITETANQPGSVALAGEWPRYQQATKNGVKMQYNDLSEDSVKTGHWLTSTVKGLSIQCGNAERLQCWPRVREWNNHTRKAGFPAEA